MNRSTEGLREMLFDTLDKFQNGKVDAAHVKAVTTICNSILATVAKDIEATKLLASLKDRPDAPKTLADLRLSLPLARNAKADVLDVTVSPVTQDAEGGQLDPRPVDGACVTVATVESNSDHEEDEPATGFGKLLAGAMRDHANGITRHKGTRY